MGQGFHRLCRRSNRTKRIECQRGSIRDRRGRGRHLCRFVRKTGECAQNRTRGIARFRAFQNRRRHHRLQRRFARPGIFAISGQNSQGDFYNIGDEVKAGDILFTIDSPDLLQAESTVAGLRRRARIAEAGCWRARSNLLKAGGSAQKDVDQSTSDEQTAEGNFKAAKDAVRIFGKTDAEIEQVVDKRKVDSTLLVPSPISGRIVARSAAPGFLTQPGNAPAPYYGRGSLDDVDARECHRDRCAGLQARARSRGQGARLSGQGLQRPRDGVGSDDRPQYPPATGSLARSTIPEHLLRSGMFASFVIHVGDPVRSLAVPAEGVVREGDGTMTVWATKRQPPFRQANREDRIAAGWLDTDLDGASARRNRRHGWRGVPEQQALVGRLPVEPSGAGFNPNAFYGGFS